MEYFRHRRDILLPENSFIHICIIAPYCYPLFNPAILTPFGGSEVRLALIAKELARKGLFHVSLVVGDHGTPHREQREGVTIYTLTGRPVWGISPARDQTPPFAPTWTNRIRIRVDAKLDIWKKKFCKRSSRAGQVGPYIITKEMTGIYHEVNADLYIVPGNSQFSTEVAFYTRKVGRKYIFLAGSDYDYYPEYKMYPEQKDMYGVPFELKTYAIENADAHIVQSERQALLLQDGYGRKGTLIKNPIDLTPCFLRAAEPRNILWIGKSDERIKRPFLVLELARLLPQYSFTLILTRIMDSVHEECLRLAGQLPNVTLIERVPYAGVERYFAEARLHVNTSVFEGMPNTFLQAAKYGVPTVSLQVDPGEMLSRHGIGLVSQGDFGRFKTEVNQVMSDELLSAQLSQKALSYVREHHDKDCIIDQYAQAISAVWGETTMNSKVRQ